MNKHIIKMIYANRIVSVKAPENVGMSSEVLHRVNKVALGS